MTVEPPRATGDDRLVVHLLGSGYGESQVVLFPGSEPRCLVVDACMSKSGGRNLTALLLRKLGVSTIDLLVVTHSDSDHIAGMSSLIDEFHPALVWYPPFFSTLRALVAQWRRADPKNKKLVELDALLKRLKKLREEDRAEMVLWSTEPWDQGPDGCMVKPIAPTHEDDAALAARLHGMFAHEESKGWIVSDVGRALLDGNKAPGDRPNTTSLAIAIQWRGRRVLLCGDVERSQWARILKKLAGGRASRLELVRELDVVKVAHHGSDTGFHAPAWSEHGKDDRSTVAIVAPFDDTVKLPDTQTLAALAGHADVLGLTSSAGDGFDRALVAGWKLAPEDAVKPLDYGESGLAIVLEQNGAAKLFASPEARFFATPPRDSFWEALRDADRFT